MEVQNSLTSRGYLPEGYRRLSMGYVQGSESVCCLEGQFELTCLRVSSYQTLQQYELMPLTPLPAVVGLTQGSIPKAVHFQDLRCPTINLPEKVPVFGL